jgi:putative flippase GtrA
MSRTGAAWFTVATTAVVRHLPVGLSRVVAPSLLGFAVINGCTFALDLSLLTVFHGVLHWPVPVSITLSYGTASSLSYLLNRILNFHSHGLVGRQVAIYTLVVAVNYFGLILGVGSGLTALGLEYQLARIAAGGCEAVWMYVAMRFLVFRDNGPASGTSGRDGGGPAAGQADGADGADQRPERRSGHDDALVRPDPR